MKIFLQFLFLTFVVSAHSIEVTISNNTLLVNNNPFYMKGVCYHPVEIGKTKRNFINLEEDLLLMQEAGINTVRVYEPIDDIAVLDQFKKAGIKVVISFGYNQQGKFDIVSGTFINYIRKYKNHDAILMWELGNEYNYNPQWFDGDINNWYRSMELVSQIIQLEDPNRLVSSAHGDLPSKEALKIYPKHLKIRNNFGIFLFKCGFQNEALNIYRELDIEELHSVESYYYYMK